MPGSLWEAGFCVVCCFWPAKQGSEHFRAAGGLPIWATALPLRWGGSPRPSNPRGGTVVHVCIERVMKLVWVLIRILLGGCNFYSFVTFSSSVVTLMLQEHCRATPCRRTNSDFIDHVPSTISVVTETSERCLTCLLHRNLRTSRDNNVLEGILQNTHMILPTIIISQC